MFKLVLNTNEHLSQQAELEEALQPLEASLSASGQTIDSERERTYALAESLDGQLARMCGDLKEVASCWILETLKMKEIAEIGRDWLF